MDGRTCPCCGAAMNEERRRAGKDGGTRTVVRCPSCGLSDVLS